MNGKIQLNQYASVILGFLLAGLSRPALAQTPQDNLYLEQNWVRTGGSYNALNGGLTSPDAVAIGPDSRIYVGDQSAVRIQVYLPDGSFSFSITNGFGGGQTFGCPKGMITDTNGDLYVADSSRSAVFVFTSNGYFIRTIGGANGTGDGQLSGVADVALGPNNEVHILENGNSRVSVFDKIGAFKRKWGAAGTLDGQLWNPLSIAASPDGRIYICQRGNGVSTYVVMKEFDVNGIWKKSTSTYVNRYMGVNKDDFDFGGNSVRLDPSGNCHVVIAQYAARSASYDWQGHVDTNPFTWVICRDGSILFTYVTTGMGYSQRLGYDCLEPCHAIGPDGTAVVVCNTQKRLMVFRQVFRDQFAVPRNAIPIPGVWAMKQRANSPLVDIDYQVTDADDATVHTAVLVFTNASPTMSLNNCVRPITLVEGSQTNLGPGIAANAPHRLTWNAGADWNVNLGDYRVAVLARDSRTNLLDIHYLTLPAERGMPTLKISRSPLVQADFMQVWWWLLATNDTGIILTSNKIYGVNGAYAAKVLCAGDNNTTADGRAYIYDKMHLREATAPEVLWAKQATMAPGSSPNQWAPGRSVSGRPAAVNEYGFDTGNWDTNTCKWVVPLN